MIKYQSLCLFKLIIVMHVERRKVLVVSYEVDIVPPKQLLARQLLSTSTLLTLKLYKQSFFVRHKVLFKSKSEFILFETRI